MKERFYAAQDGIGIIKITVELGKPEITIELSDSKLNWNSLTLDKNYSDRLVEFLSNVPRQRSI